MKTVIAQIKDKIKSIGFTNVDEFFVEFLEIEKKQIIDLCTEAYELGLGHKEYNAEETYNEIFNKL